MITCIQLRRTLAIAGSGDGGAGQLWIAFARELAASRTPGGDDAKP